MGFFDSKKTTKNTNVTNDYTTSYADNRYSENDIGAGAVGISGDVAGALTLNTSDFGAVEAGIDLAGESLELAGGVSDNTFDFSRDVLGEVTAQLTGTAQDFAQLTQRSLEGTQSAYRTANTSEDGQLSQKMVLYLAVVAALWLMAPAIQKMFKA